MGLSAQRPTYGPEPDLNLIQIRPADYSRISRNKTLLFPPLPVFGESMPLENDLKSNIQANRIHTQSGLSLDHANYASPNEDGFFCPRPHRHNVF
jgi:hypothetical protein